MAERKRQRRGDYQPTQAELDEPLTIDATPEELGATIMGYRPPRDPEGSDD